jgi:hypothetical protein
VRYDLKGDWDLIGEYQGTYSLNDVRLDDGGHFSTNAAIFQPTLSPMRSISV